MLLLDTLHTSLDIMEHPQWQYTGWWFGTFFIFPYIGNSNPNWRTHIFQRGRYTTNQCIVSPWFPFIFHLLFLSESQGSKWFTCRRRWRPSTKTKKISGDLSMAVLFFHLRTRSEMTSTWKCGFPPWNIGGFCRLSIILWTNPMNLRYQCGQKMLGHRVLFAFCPAESNIFTRFGWDNL